MKDLEFKSLGGTPMSPNSDSVSQTPKKNVESKSLFNIKDDAEGTVGHGTFEMDDIKAPGGLEFITKYSLEQKLKPFIGKNIADVESDVQGVLEELMLASNELKKGVDVSGMKGKDGVLSPKGIIDAFYKIETNSGEISPEYLTAVNSVLAENLGLVSNKSWDGGRQHVYVLQDGSMIAYTHGRHVTVQTPDGQRISYDMKGEKLDSTPEDNLYTLDMEVSIMERAAEPENQARVNAMQEKLAQNRAMCPILNPNKESDVSMQGLMKSPTGFPEYNFTDSTGRIISYPMSVFDNSTLEFDENKRLIKIQEMSRGETLSLKYDERGNLTNIISDNNPNKICQMTYDVQNRVTSRNFTMFG